MREYNFKKADWYRFEKLCQSFGFRVETGATYTYSNLVETEHCFLRIIKNGSVVAIADIIE